MTSSSENSTARSEAARSGAARSGAAPSEAEDSAREVDVHRAAELAASGARMLDVREADEWSAGHIEGAMHVPLGQLEPAAIPLGVPIVAVCRSGNRSGTATAKLRAAGHDVVNMSGGMLAWTEAGLPVATDGSGPGTV